MGGYDIFKSEIKNGEIQPPENVGPSINTPRNDLVYISSEKNKIIFSKLADDKSFEIIDPKSLLVTITGTVNALNQNNNINKFTINGDSLLLKDLETNKNTFKFLAPKQKLTYTIKAKGFKDKKINIDLSEYKGETKEITINLEPVSKEIIAENTNKQTTETDNNIPKTEQATTNTDNQNPILFAFDKYNLTDEAKQAIDSKIKQIPENAKIIISAYTDSKGSVAYNKILSKKRAESVKKYLTNKGYKNVTAVGKGILQDSNLTDRLKRKADIIAE